MDEFALILYPFITGNEAMKVGMTRCSMDRIWFNVETNT